MTNQIQSSASIVSETEASKKVNIQKNIYQPLVSHIVIENENIREDYSVEAFERLKASIKINGVIQPIQVKKKKGEEIYVLVQGFNRYRAVLELIAEGFEIERIPAMPVSYSLEEELLNHIVSNSGEPLTKYETSKVLVRLSNYGWSNKELSAKTGYSEMEISNLLIFQRQASTEVKKAVASNELAITTATQLVRETENVDEQNTKLSEAKAKKSDDKKKITSSDILNSSKEKAKKISFEKRFTELVSAIESAEITNREMLVSVFYMLNQGSTTEEILAELSK